jgi:hypothetical protein
VASQREECRRSSLRGVTVTEVHLACRHAIVNLISTLSSPKILGAIGLREDWVKTTWYAGRERSVSHEQIEHLAYGIKGIFTPIKNHPLVVFYTQHHDRRNSLVSLNITCSFK